MRGALRLRATLLSKGATRCAFVAGVSSCPTSEPALVFHVEVLCTWCSFFYRVAQLNECAGDVLCFECACRSFSLLHCHQQPATLAREALVPLCRPEAEKLQHALPLRVRHLEEGLRLMICHGSACLCPQTLIQYAGHTRVLRWGASARTCPNSAACV
eukprot:22982-Pleurochrysis_carterae.AAC.1